MPEQIEIGKVYTRFEVDMAPVHAQFRDIEREAKASARRSGESFSEGFTPGVRGALAAVTGLVMILADRGVSAMRGFFGWVGRTTSGLVDLTALGVLRVSAGLRTMSEATRNAEGELSALGKAGNVAASGLETVAKVALTISGVLTGLQIVTAGLTAKLLLSAHRAASEFAPSWNRVVVSVGESSAALDRLRTQVSLLAGEIGVDGVEAANTFYEILGSMPQLLADPARAMEILRVSMEAGSTGFTDAASAAKATGAVLTAFNLEAEEARRVSDALFMAQGLGATTYGEIADAIGRVSGLTSALGGDFEELLGIIATLTPTGISTSEVLTQVRSALTNIIKPSERAREAAEELGLDFSAASLQAKGLNGFLADIIATTNGEPDVLARLFGSDEALALLVSLVDKTAELDRWTNEIRNSAGATEQAVSQMNDSWERQKEILGERFSASLRSLGMEFEGFGVTALQAINGVLGKMNELDNALAGRGGPVGVGRQAGEATREWFDGILEEIDSWLDRMYGRAGRIPTLPGVTNRPAPWVMNPVGSTQVIRRSAGAEEIARPEEPTSIEYSQAKIRERERQLRALAAAEFARTQNMEAFQAATRAAEGDVNRLILAEAQRLRAAGAEERVVNELLAMYQVTTDRASAAAAAVRSALERRTEESTRYVQNLRAEASAAEEIGRTDLAEKWTAEADAMERLNAQIAAFTPNVTRPREMGGDDPGPSVGALTHAFSQRTLELQEQLAREVIDPDEYERLGREAAEAFRSGILSKIDALREAGKLTREQWEELVGLLPDVADNSEEIAEKAERTAREYANVARAVVSMADAMGAFDDETRRSIEGVILLLENLWAIQGALSAGAALSAGSIVGAIGGIAALITAFQSSAEEEHRARMQQLDATYDLSRALRELRDAVITEISLAERGEIMAAGESFVERYGYGGYRPGGAVGRKPDLTNEEYNFLRELERITGQSEILNEATGEINWELFRAAWEAFKDADVGAFGQDLLGRLDALDYASSIAGDALGTAADQMNLFIDTVRQFSPEFAEEFQRILSEQGPEAARAWLEQQAVSFAQPGGAANLGAWAAGLTPEEIQRIIDEALDRTDALRGGVTGGGSTRLSVSITEVQANTMLAQLSTQTLLLQSIDVSARMMAGRMASTEVAIPSAASLGLGTPAAQGSVIDLRGASFPIYFDGPAPAPASEAEWGAAGEAFGSGLGRKLVDVAAGAGIDRGRIQIRRPR